MIVAHVVAPGGPPLYASWLASLVLFGGAVGAMVWWRDRRRRVLCTALAGLGLVATATLLVVQPSAPARPGYSIRIPDMHQVTSPVDVRVCSVADVGTPAPVPGPDRLLLLSVDGHQVGELRSDTEALPMTVGAHTVTAQLITADHRAFVPPITTAATVTVTGQGPIQPPPTCAP